MGAEPDAGESTCGGASLVQLGGVTKRYSRGNETVDVLKNVDMTIEKGSFHALMGPSGSGKSTLLNIIAGMDTATTGTVRVAGWVLSAMTEDARATWRANHVGFIFQTFNLMPVLNAVENVALPLLLTKLSAEERDRRARIALKIVGLSDRTRHFPNELSGGQQQRVALARAIVMDPSLIVADEPTGDLDRQSADEVLDLLCALCESFGKTVIMVTHDPAAGDRASVAHRLDKGEVV
jgi:putative ABC transport system ATP-binding protein